MHTQLESLTQAHLTELVNHIGARPTGSPANQRAGAYLKRQFADVGWQVETPPFVCLWWEGGSARLTCGSDSFAAQVNPYSPPFEGIRPFVVVDTLQALEAHADLRGRFVVLTGTLANDAYFPLNFPFVTFDEQQRVVRHLLAAQPDAVIGVGGAVPLFCDADFSLPSVTVTDAPRFLDWDRPLCLSITSRVTPSTGYNVIARSAKLTPPKIVISAHYDTWFDTPGGIDNAAGVTVLLLLAHLLNPHTSNVEFVVFNGEDHYAAPGEVSYLAKGIGETACCINVDGVGAKGHSASTAYFGDAPALFDRIRAEQQRFPGIVTAEPWYESDHTMFVQQGIPAVALTSVPFDDALRSTHHTAADTVDQVDGAALVEVARFLQQIVT
jgi:aminopeptidase YwaD